MAGALSRPLSGIPAARTEGGKDGTTVLSYGNSKPLYGQVTERLRELMFKGALLWDAQLPSVRGLVTELSTDPNTIQRAYTELERQGHIYSIKGKDSLVADSNRTKVGILQEWKGHFNPAVEEGIKVGVTAGGTKEMIGMAYRNHATGKGESSD